MAGSFVFAFQIATSLLLWLCFSVWHGLLFLFLFPNAVRLIAIYVYDLEPMYGIDTMWLMDTEVNRSNILGIAYMERGSAAAIKATLVERGGKRFPRTRSRIVNFWGYLFFKAMPIEEAENALHTETPYPIHNDRDLEKFLSSIANTKIPLHRPQLECWIIEDFSPEESIIVWKMHHSLTDGLGMISLMAYQTKGFRLENLPSMKAFSFAQKIFAYLSLPLMAPYVFYKYGTKGRDRNVLYKNKQKGKKAVLIGQDFPLSQVKALAKRHSSTINDVITSVVTVALKQHLAELGDPDVLRMKFVIPMSLKSSPTSMEQINLRNEFACTTIEVPLHANFTVAVQAIGSYMRRLKRSLEPVAAMLVSHIAFMYCPQSIARYIAKTANKATVVFSNIPGHKQALEIGGSRSRRMLFFVPSLGRIGIGISVLSHLEYIKIGVMADTNCVDGRKLINRLDGTLQEQLDRLKIE